MDELKKDEKLLKDTRKLFEHAFEAEQERRQEMIDDLKFSYAIDQWEEEARKEREKEGRPALTIDRIGDTVRKILGSMRQNRPAIKVLPAEGGDKETAEIINDLIREIEYSSRSSSVYMTAANHQVRCGYGVIGVTSIDNSTDAWTQDLKLRRYRNPFAVYFDPEAMEQDKSDGDLVFESEWFSEHKFNKKFPGKEFPGGGFDGAEVGQTNELWYSDKKARVIKAWRKMPVERTVCLLSDTRTVEKEKLSDSDRLEIQSGALRIVKEKKVRSHKVIRFVMTENEIIEGVDDWPGKFIPVVPVYGEEVDIEGLITWRGIVRTAKDPQRLYNYARTTNAETLMEQPRAPYLVGASQLPPDLRPMWNEANQGKKPYLAYDDSVNANPPLRQPPPTISSGYVQEAQIASDDLQRATGIFDTSLGARSNEVSGIAIQARQQGSDTGTFIFPDNLGVAIEQLGRILVELIPHFYDTQRIIRLRGEDDSEREVGINQLTIGENGQPEIKRDLGRGKYDVRVSTGPSHQTQRLEARDSMIGFIQAIPAAGPLVADLVAKNMDWPGADEFAERLKLLLPPGTIEEEDPEKQAAMQQQAQEAQELKQLQLQMAKNKSDSEALEKAARARKTKLEGDEIETRLEAVQVGALPVEDL